MRAVILAAGRGARLGALTADIPKCLLALSGGLTILDWTLAALRSHAVPVVEIVSGHAHDALARHIGAAWSGTAMDLRLVYNPEYAAADNIKSLGLCRRALLGADEVLVVNSDVVFDPGILELLVAAPESALVIDDRKALGGEEMKVTVAGGGRVTAISKRLDPEAADGEYIGLAKLAPPVSGALLEAIDRHLARGAVNAYYEDALHDVLSAVRVGTVTAGGRGWVEVDTPDDLAAARRLFQSFHGEGLIAPDAADKRA